MDRGPWTGLCTEIWTVFRIDNNWDVGLWQYYTGRNIPAYSTVNSRCACVRVTVVCLRVSLCVYYHSTSYTICLNVKSNVPIEHKLYFLVF